MLSFAHAKMQDHLIFIRGRSSRHWFGAMDRHHHRRHSRPWLPLLLLLVSALVLSSPAPAPSASGGCQLHRPADGGSTETTGGTDEEVRADGGDCHGRNHSHHHGHHGGGGGGKARPGTTPVAASNPWVISHGHPASKAAGAATGVALTGAALCWLLAP